MGEYAIPTPYCICGKGYCKTYGFESPIIRQTLSFAVKYRFLDLILSVI